MTEVADPEDIDWSGDTVEIAGVAVADSSRSDIVDWLCTRRSPGKPLLAYALHIGGMVHLQDDPDYGSLLDRSAIVYADGAGPVLIGRARGGRLERSATTDLAPELLEQWKKSHGQPARVALIGGPKDLSKAAGDALLKDENASVVFTEHGYHDSWGSVLDALRKSQPDIVFVGMGAPLEMQWCEAHYDLLPNSIVMTCGGWFGFLTGNETRAPAWLQRVGGEWVWRLLQNPKRLANRYFRGSAIFLRELLNRDGRA
ncbi:WecB/TagA/CpsF family glycosyltransferase [Paenarthrobacter sp. TYUT067]|uniref:WecB/TagA/CpsF family glycosyltransferase n=1 Tax=Paenarthrobacter sp. TYUT067 TaxID=2926245 RepID=UPI00203035E4|nr:WecB/TagA/CpsF family glycosyltransferase [Paenarthrobacter sp. TYUT067]MCM0615265.1 WecB/TagA/CpsF family glycosyltransferase [Paenarthrobacter sp. TYUT067]